MSFRKYLANRKLEYDARSDFTRLAIADPQFPDAETLRDVQIYVQEHHGSEVMWHAASDVWSEYEAAGRRSVNLRTG